MLDDQALAQSDAVARLAMRQLGLTESVSSFVPTYVATVMTDRVLRITVEAPTSEEAVSRATAVAAEFLRFRAAQLESQQNQLFSALNQQINLDKQQINAMGARIRQLSGERATPAQQAELSQLDTQRSDASAQLALLKQTTLQTQANSQIATQTATRGSQVLDAAIPVPPKSQKKRLLEYAAVGLIAGLTLGLAIVVIGALVSDRLRRRDDVANALAAPVKLSVGRVRLSRWLPSRRGLAAAGSSNVQRIARYLGSVMPPGSDGLTALAVVPVGNSQVAALSLVSLALDYSEQGLRVIVADLCSGSPAGRLLGASHAGVQEVLVDGIDVVVAIPDSDDAAPRGPLDGARQQADRRGFAGTVAEACPSADLLLTLVALDPALGGDHLPSWASGAVVVVTAGDSSAAGIQAAGEMIRLAGTPLISGVLVGADRTDESLGVPQIMDSALPPRP
jgi:capsular polysaccharide biosynthesis protein